MKKVIFIVGFLFTYILSPAQNISGLVTNDNKEPLMGASVYWLNGSSGTMTDYNGAFTLTNNKGDYLITSYIGHISDTIKITNQTSVTFTLKKEKSFQEILLKSEQGILISNHKGVKVEQITKAELKKAACCDLAGCFETQISVQPQTTNVITNSKELRILGLSGTYNQVLIDGLPMIQGLSYTYGISSIPGTLVDNIFVSKGANSVLQGYESISGQINVLTKKPDATDKLLVNIYMNSFLEKQLNVNYAFQKNKWSNLSAMQIVQPANRVDRDEDSFLDVPLLTRYLFFNKWKYGKATDWGWNSQIGFRIHNEKRVGGQKAFNENIHKGSNEIYGQHVRYTQPEVWTKTGYRFDDTKAITLNASSFYQDQKSYFGTVSYDAEQYNFYAKAQFDLDYNGNSLKTGLSFRHLEIKENIGFTDNSLGRTYAGEYQRVENIPGFFAENTMYFLKDKLTWIAGIRGDQHNQFGFEFTPRTTLKYDITENTVLRGNIGSGWRTVNVFSENIGLLASSRDILIANDLKPEKALNYGVNITQKFQLENKDISGYLSLDYYRTNFENQIFPDYDTNTTQAIVQNFEGTSVSKGFQAEFYLNFWKQLEWKSGYTYLDVYRNEGETKKQLPFNPQHKVISTIGYKPLSKKWLLDANIHWYGKKTLPNTQSNPMPFQRENFSDPYTVVNAQATYTANAFEFYGGCENIFDFRQKNAIIGSEDPFGPYFDTSSVWGPTRGREFYLGIRYKI